MSTTEKGKLPDLGLRQLLDGIQQSHSKDIAAYTGGHLNESKLWKPPDASTHKSWKSALKPSITLVPPSTIPKRIDPSENKNVEKMREALATFSTGMLTDADTQPLPEAFKDSAYIEEYKPNKLKLDKHGARGRSKDGPLQPLKKVPILSYKDAITMKDQLQAIRQFKDDFINTSPRTLQKNRFGDMTIETIEEQLEKKLEAMPQVPRGTNFRRVQAFGGAFDDLIDNSPTFGYMLKTIKNEYDAYLSFLLDTQLGNHKELHHQVTQLSSRGTSKKLAHLQHQIDEVDKTELEAKALLEENDRLRYELEKELELSRLPETALESPKESEQPTKQDKHRLVSDIEDLNTQVLEKMDEVKRIRDKLQQECVPAIVCNHLEQCIKDTEVEIQRLTTQKEYFITSKSETEEALHNAIEYADTTEKDASRIWEKVQVKLDEDGNVIIEDSDDETDEDAKWSWYIS